MEEVSDVFVLSNGQEDRQSDGEMKRLLVTCLYLLILVFVVKCAQAQASFQTEAVNLPAGVPEAPRNLLEPLGTRLVWVVNGTEMPLSEVWWRKMIPGRAKPGNSRDSSYPDLETGAFLGIIYLPGITDDFKHQQLAAGFYTMRYARFSPHRPEHEDKEEGEDVDGSEQDVNRGDFVTLDKLEPDKDQAIAGNLTQVITTRAEGTADKRFRLMPVNRLYKNFPSVVSDDRGNCIVQFRLQLRTRRNQIRALQLAILLVNPPNLSLDD